MNKRLIVSGVVLVVLVLVSALVSLGAVWLALWLVRVWLGDLWAIFIAGCAALGAFVWYVVRQRRL